MTTRSRVAHRGVVVTLALACAAPMLAQQASTSSGVEQDQQLRYQLQTFEAVLQSAVKHGGDAFARQNAGLIPPGVQLTSDDPEVKGFAPPQGGGLMFVVVVPQIRPTVTYFLAQHDMPGGGLGLASASPSASPEPSSEPNVKATGLASADPMTKSPVIGAPGATPFDVDYTISVVEALKDALLDNSGPLPIHDDEWLTVAAIDGVGVSAGVVNSPFDVTTYLSIKGSDLARLRQQKITRDDARKLILVRQF